MRFKGTFFLALVLVAISLYFFLIEVPQKKKEGEEKEREEKVWVFNPDDIEEMHVISSQADVILSRQGDNWEMQKPLKTKADKGTIEGIVSRLKSATISRIVEESPAELDTYGLTHPTVRILLKFKGKDKAEELSIGEMTQVGHSTYLKKGDSPRVYLAGSYLHDDLQKTLFDFRSKDLVKFEREEIKEIQVESRRYGSYVIGRSGEGDWVLLKPLAGKADRVEVIQGVAALEDLKILEFVGDKPGAPEELGLNPPQLKIRLIFKEGKEDYDLVLGNDNKKGAFARASGQESVIRVGIGALTTFDKNYEEFHDRTLLDFTPDKVERIIYKKAGRVVKEVSADKENISAGLKELRAADFVSREGKKLAGYQLDPALEEIEVIEKAADPDIKGTSHRLRIGKEDVLKGGVYVYKEREKIIFLAEEKKIKEVLRTLDNN